MTISVIVGPTFKSKESLLFRTLVCEINKNIIENRTHRNTVEICYDVIEILYELFPIINYFPLMIILLYEDNMLRYSEIFFAYFTGRRMPIQGFH